MRIDGLDEAMREINTQIAEFKNISQTAFWEVGLKVQASAQRRLTPSVVTGNLRASAYTRSAKQLERLDDSRIDPLKNEAVPTGGLGPIGVEIGFTANYALWVHENMEGRSPKYLENAVMQNRDGIVKIIQQRSENELE